MTKQEQKDTVVEFFRHLRNICVEAKDCDNCPLNAPTCYIPDTLLPDEELNLRDLRRFVDRAFEVRVPAKPTYYDDFRAKFPAASENFWRILCRNAVYTGHWSCPQGRRYTDNACKACWKEKMEVTDE